METRAISKTGRVDSMGNGHSCGGNDFTGDYCVCFASEREGKIAVIVLIGFLY